MEVFEPAVDLLIRLEKLLIGAAQQEGFKHARAQSAHCWICTGNQVNPPEVTPSVV